jgi:hypothetical protein
MTNTDLEASYEKVMEALEERKRRMNRLQTMLIGLYAVTVVMLFIGAWLSVLYGKVLLTYRITS